MAKKSIDPRACYELGARLEYLAGVASHQVIPWTGLGEFPRLSANQPGLRFAVPRVVEALQSLLAHLEKLEFSQALAAAEPLRPMLKEMEEYLAAAESPQTSTLNDPFADRMAHHAQQVRAAVQEELPGA